MNKYQNGKIYTIRSPHTEKFYIGSTCQTLCKRFYKHNHDTQNLSSHKIINLGDAYIELLELFPCNSKDELNKREHELIRLNKDNIVNIKLSVGLPEKEQKKIWHEDHREKELARMKEYNKLKINCPHCQLEITKNHLKRHIDLKHNNII